MQLHVVTKGKGKPILLLHGLLSDHRQVMTLLPALREHTVYLPDLLGCGKSDKTPTPDIIKQNAKLLKILCRKHRIKTVIAYSISSLIAFELKLPNTIIISGFCTNPLHAGPLQMITERFQGYEPKVKELLLTNERPAQRFIKQYVKTKLLPGVQQASVSCATEYMLAAEQDYTQLAKKLKRTLVIHGTKDQLIHYHLGVRLATVANASLVVVPENHASILKNKTVHSVLREFINA